MMMILKIPTVELWLRKSEGYRTNPRHSLLIHENSAEWAMLRKDEVDINGGWEIGTP
jgi:hypothetical protein